MKLLLILCIVLAGCYTKQKAATQFGKAAITYPEIPADYCARTYPARDSLIKGDTVSTFDTIYIAGEQFFDTVQVGDTVRITRTIKEPGKTIIQTIRVTDTVERESIGLLAKLDLCNIEKREIAAALVVEQKRADKYQGQAKTRLWLIIGLLAAVAVWLYFKLKPKK